MTDARKRELEKSRGQESPSSRLNRIWSSVARIVLVVLPLLFVIDGLFLRIGLLYSPSLTFPTPADMVVQGAGIALSMAALALMTTVGRTLAKRVFAMSTEERQLITTGAYAYVRHPFYLHFILLPLGWLLLTLNVLALLIVLFYNTLDGPISPTRFMDEEEAELLARHGREYEEYMKRTGRLLPRWRR